MTPEDQQNLADLARAVTAEETKKKGLAAGFVMVVLVAPFFYFLSTNQMEGEPAHALFFWFAVGSGVLGGLGILTGLPGKPAPATMMLSKDGYRKCSQCAESIKAEAKKCRYCGSEVLPDGS